MRIKNRYLNLTTVKYSVLQAGDSQITSEPVDFYICVSLSNRLLTVPANLS